MAAGAAGGRRRLPHGGGRERGEHVPRPRHRRPHGAHAAAPDPVGADDAARGARVRCGALDRRHRALRVRRERAQRGARARRILFLRVHLHAVAQAAHAAEHRDRRRGGRFPPLVGWAAVTGSLDLTAIYLFLIVFYWTPPHFWALALLKQHDYGRAGVPMAPLVWGERETNDEHDLVHAHPRARHAPPRRFRRLRRGVLGERARARRAPAHRHAAHARRSEWVPLAWRVYKYSLLYLALLFVAMVVDRGLAR